MSGDLKVINLGFPKSGTTTLGKALSAAGLRVADWKVRPDATTGETRRAFVGQLMYKGWYGSGDPLEHLSGYDALSEIDVVRNRRNYWPQCDWALIEAIRLLHPGARFLLSMRDPGAQAASMRRWSDMGETRLPASSVPGLPKGFGGKPGELERWIEGHVSFCHRVFAGADDFLAFDIADPQARDSIAGFLGVDLPWWGKANANPADRQPEGNA